MLKEMKPGRQYFIINIDEPYAEEIYEILKQGQMKKGDWPEGNVSFDVWKKLTFCEGTERQKDRRRMEIILSVIAVCGLYNFCEEVEEHGIVKRDGRGADGLIIDILQLPDSDFDDIVEYLHRG